VDVRTGKKYTLNGEGSFFKDIGRWFIIILWI
jgi:hypothetical protein